MHSKWHLAPGLLAAACWAAVLGSRGEVGPCLRQAQWVSLRTEGPTMHSGHAALLALARGLVLWHEGEAGEAPRSVPVQGGHARCAGRQAGRHVQLMVIRAQNRSDLQEV